jgi:hypothetical protein
MLIIYTIRVYMLRNRFRHAAKARDRIIANLTTRTIAWQTAWCLAVIALVNAASMLWSLS